MKIDELIAAVQKKLGITADGRAGPETWAAVRAFVVGKGSASETSAAVLIDSVDARSEVRTWGGNWKNPVDQAHFEWHPDWARGLSEAQLLAAARARVERGEDLAA